MPEQHTARDVSRGSCRLYPRRIVNKLLTGAGVRGYTCQRRATQITLPGLPLAPVPTGGATPAVIVWLDTREDWPGFALRPAPKSEAHRMTTRGLRERGAVQYAHPNYGRAGLCCQEPSPRKRILEGTVPRNRLETSASGSNLGHRETG